MAKLKYSVAKYGDIKSVSNIYLIIVISVVVFNHSRPMTFKKRQTA